eukprot:1207730-Rhodomonas_salina.1
MCKSKTRYVLRTPYALSGPDIAQRARRRIAERSPGVRLHREGNRSPRGAVGRSIADVSAGYCGARACKEGLPCEDLALEERREEDAHLRALRLRQHPALQHEPKAKVTPYLLISDPKRASKAA